MPKVMCDYYALQQTKEFGGGWIECQMCDNIT